MYISLGGEVNFHMGNNNININNHHKISKRCIYNYQVSVTQCEIFCEGSELQATFSLYFCVELRQPTVVNSSHNLQNVIAQPLLPDGHRHGQMTKNWPLVIIIGHKIFFGHDRENLPFILNFRLCFIIYEEVSQG